MESIRACSAASRAAFSAASTAEIESARRPESAFAYPYAFEEEQAEKIIAIVAETKKRFFIQFIEDLIY